MDLQEQLTELANQEFSLGDIIKATPFEPQRNINGFFTKEIFFKKAFVLTEPIKSWENEFNKFTSSEIDTYRTFIINEFSGAGKTTFVNYLSNKHKNTFHSIYIDFRKITSSTPTGVNDDFNFVFKGLLDEIEEIKTVSKKRKNSLIDAAKEAYGLMSNPLVSSLKDFIIKDNNLKYDFIRFISRKNKYLIEYLREETLKKLLRLSNNHDFSLNFKKALSNVTDKEIFILFFLYIFFTYNSNKKKLIIFDNLDAIEVNFLSNRFRQEFERVLDTIAELSQVREIFDGSFRFELDYKFIFCVRDANGAIVQTHFDSLIANERVKIYHKSPHNFDTYEKILISRIELYTELLKLKDEKTNENKIKEINSIKSFIYNISKDYYFRQIIIPLFNFDTRKIFSTLLETIEDCFSYKSPNSLLPNDFDFKSFNYFELYGFRGLLMYSIVKKLSQEDFLQSNPFFNEEPANLEGSCLKSRMILSVVLNKSSIAHTSDAYGNFKKAVPVLLSDVVNYCIKVYSISEIIRTLAGSFLFHKRNWCNLVTFRNKQVTDRNSFDNEIFEIEKTPDESKIDAINNCFKKITIDLNPAGFIYLKHLIPHFEYFSIRQGNQASLFIIGTSKSKESNFDYIFEEYIEKVYSKIRHRIISMNKFYERIFEKGLAMTPDDYKKSDFSFKHYGHGLSRNVGYFHSSRILNSHIDYLDKFRRCILDPTKKKLPPSELFNVNKKMVLLIEKYNALFKLTKDDEDLVFYRAYQKHIDKIKGSKYTNLAVVISSMSKYRDIFSFRNSNNE